MKIGQKPWRHMIVATMICALIVGTAGIQTVNAAEDDNVPSFVSVLQTEEDPMVGKEESGERPEVENVENDEHFVNEMLEGDERLESESVEENELDGEFFGNEGEYFSDTRTPDQSKNELMVNEAIDECEKIDGDEPSTELKAGQIASLPTFSSNGYTSAAITKNGDLYCWGNNTYGQVGNGSTKDQSVPVKVLKNVVSVSVYGYASNEVIMAAITKNGDLYCWGHNTYGQVGNGSTKNRQVTPVKVLGDVISVYGYSNVYASGYGSGRTTIAAVTKNGDLYCWGNNSYGQVGNGSTAYRQDTPVKVLENVTSVYAPTYMYGSHTMAVVTRNGDLYCWGDNSYGKVGNGSTAYHQDTPVKVLENVASVYGFGSGSANMAAITRNGDLYCWGDNTWGQVGNGAPINQSSMTFQSTPVKVLENVSSVHGFGYAPGDMTIAAITKNGDLYCWGDNGYGKVGNGGSLDQNTPAKVLENVASVYGFGYSCGSGYGSGRGSMAAITKNGDLYCWGHNDHGQVGNGKAGATMYQNTPVKVLENATSVYSYIYGSGANSTTVAAVTKNGDLYCWGSNGYGQVGNGNTIGQNTPVKVLENVVSVDVPGYTLMAAVTDNGDLYYWGDDLCGQMENERTTQRSIPVKMLENVASVDSYVSVYGFGPMLMAAITRNGELYCWGYNAYGQVGNGNTTDQDTLVKILDLMTGDQTSLPSGTPANTHKTPNKGARLKSGNDTYKVTKKDSEVAYTKTSSTAANVVIPTTVKIDGIDYKVTSIAPNAFKDNERLTKVTIKADVTTIGTNVFYGCKDLKIIIIKSTKLKSIGKNAFKGIGSNAKIKVPSKKLKAYKKLLKGKGQGKKVKITK